METRASQVSRGARTDHSLPRPSTAAAVGVLAILAASYIVNAADRQVFPVLVPQIQSDLHFALSQGGLLATVFTLGIGIAGIPTGRLLDKISRKSAMLIGIALYSAFTVLTAQSLGFGDMLTYRALSGIGESLQNAALFSAVGAFFFTRRSFAIGVLNLSYGLGGFLGPLLGADLASATGNWRVPLYLFGGIGFLFAVVILLTVSRRFTEVKDGAGPAVAVPDSNAPRTLLNRDSILLCVVAALAGLAVLGYLGLYPTFLQSQLHLSLKDAGLAASLYGIGSMVASVPAGWLGDRIGNKAVIILALSGSIVVAFIMFFIATTTVEQAILSFLVGAFGSGLIYVNLYAGMQKSLHPSIVGRASGAFITWFYLPAALAGYLFSLLVGHVGWHGAALVQLMAFPAIGIVCALLISARPGTGSAAR
ncbi:MAG TPA: MFS transporter [Gryllotalpicola sp.]